MNKWPQKNWIVDASQEGMRLFNYIRDRLQSFDNIKTKDIRWSIEHHRCLVNGQVERFTSRRLCSKDKITFQVCAQPHFTLEKSRILFEDEWLFAYDKPPAIPMTGEMSLQTLLKYAMVHRLDRDTTGAVLFAKTRAVQENLEALFRHRQMQKSYLACVLGKPRQESGTIENYLGQIAKREGEIIMGVVEPQRGLTSTTSWQCLAHGIGHALIRAHPKTGRTHQVRVHLSHIGHPIVGDVRYGPRKQQAGEPRPLLHAHTLEFTHPMTRQELKIEAPLPADFLQAMERYGLAK